MTLRIASSSGASLLTTGGGALFGGTGFVADLIPVWLRLVLLGISVLLMGLGWMISRKAEASQRATAVRVDELASKLESAQEYLKKASPEATLDQLARAIFQGTGAWRLTVYVLEQSNSEFWLRRLLRRSGSEVYEVSGRERIRLDKTSLREIPNVDISDWQRPHANLSGAFPNRDSAPDEWRTQQFGVVGDMGEVMRLAMPTRRYAWCVSREQDGRRTCALVAESVDPDGIQFDAMSSPFVSLTIAMLVKLADLPGTVVAPVDSVATALRTS